jgi:hypothetical protein
MNSSTGSAPTISDPDPRTSRNSRCELIAHSSVDGSRRTVPV